MQPVRLEVRISPGRSRLELEDALEQRKRRCNCNGD